MFDATNGNQKVADQVDELSDEFAARFEELTPRQRVIFLSKANQLLDNPDDVTAFNTGTYAQNNAGQPAAALGGGSGSASTSVPVDMQAALQVIRNDARVSDSMMAAIARVLSDSSDPGHIAVEPDGTPTELKTTRTQRDANKTAKEAAEKELKDERDDTKSGSLAKQLKDAKASPATPAGTVEKSKVKTEVDKLAVAVANLNAPVGKVRGKAEVDDAVAKLEALC